MDLNVTDVIRLLHPILAVTIVFPLLGIVVKQAWQTRQRRLQTAAGEKSKIPPIVGPEHVQVGRWLTGAVVGVALLGMARPTFSQILSNQVWNQAPLKVILIGLMYLAAIASLVLLYQATTKVWRAVFATLSGMAVVILGFQDGVYRRDNEWFVSHFYFGLVATLLMIVSLAIVQEIYQDRSQRWRMVHILLNCIALLLFLAQGVTGTRDLLEIPLSWQESTVYRCTFDKTSPAYKTCPPLAPPP